MSKIVCILGPHRSGTSLITRVLNLLGLYLGPEDNMRKARKWNPRGYWEHQPIIDLNDSILSRLGGSWHEPPQFPLRWELAPELEDLRQLARDYIRRNFADAPLWGWKDPRTCLTLPFWQQLLRPLSYLFCLRSPLEAAQSLKRRNRYSLQKGIYLWVIYLEHALNNAAGPERQFVFYEDLLADWKKVIPDLSSILGQSQTTERMEIEQALTEFIDPDLRHHNLQSEDSIPDGSESAHLSHQLYLELRRETKTDPERIPQLLQDAFEILKAQLNRERPW